MRGEEVEAGGGMLFETPLRATEAPAPVALDGEMEALLK